jgi:hypothetical protein
MRAAHDPFVELAGEFCRSKTDIVLSAIADDKALAPLIYAPDVPHHG